MPTAHAAQPAETEDVPLAQSATGEKSAGASAFGKGRWISGRSKRPIPTFAFSCDRCGRCGREREDVLLNPADLFRIAKFLNQTPSQVVEHYCECCIGPDSGLPLIRLKPKAYRNTCHFWDPNAAGSLSLDNPITCHTFLTALLSRKFFD